MGGAGGAGGAGSGGGGGGCNLLRLCYLTVTPPGGITSGLKGEGKIAALTLTKWTSPDGRSKKNGGGWWMWWKDEVQVKKRSKGLGRVCKVIIRVLSNS